MKSSLATILAVSLVGGCGTYVPQMQEAWEGADITGDMELNIKKRVYCDVRGAIKDAKSDFVGSSRGKSLVSLPDDWGVQITLNMQVEEKSGLSPNITLNKTLPTSNVLFPGRPSVPVSQIFTFGLGGTASSTATRIDKFSFFYNVGDLSKDIGSEDTSCKDLQSGTSFLLLSNLGISDWLHNALLTQNVRPSTELPSTQKIKLDVISYEIKFVVVTNGNINPAWKLVNVSSNVSGMPLIDFGRTRTHDLTITMGPSSTEPTAGGRLVRVPGKAVTDSHLASQIGLSVANNIRSVFAP